MLEAIFIISGQHLVCFMEKWTWAHRVKQLDVKRIIFTLGCVHAKLLQSCLTLCDAMDYSPPGSSVHGILQAGIMDGVVMPSSTGPSWPRDQIPVSYVSCIGRQALYHYCHLGSPILGWIICNYQYPNFFPREMSTEYVQPNIFLFFNCKNIDYT